MDFKNIRRQFPALGRRVNGKRLVYFDNACSVLKPRAVIKAVNDYLSTLGSCAGGRSGHALSAATEELCYEARVKTASFIGAAAPSEIIFTSNTTEAINLAARCFPFTKEKNEVVLTAFDHHSNMLPFLEEQRRGNIKVRMAGLDGGWELGADRICGLITPRTALVSLPRASNVTGQLFPVEAVAREAHRRGAVVLADAAQYLSTSREDVRAAGIDMLAFSGHKLGAPPGIGALYCRAGLMRRLKNFKVGGGTVSDVRAGADGLPEARYFSDHRRFEAGIQNYAGILGLGAALDFLNEAGPDRIKRHTAGLAGLCRTRLAALDEVQVLGPAAAGGAIVSFAFKDSGIFAQDFNLFLNNELPGHVVCARCGNHCAIPLHRARGIGQSLRLSFFIYNTEREVRVFLEALDAFLGSAASGRRTIR
ncbi:MAG TPA: aminotransferase class V-fold PLP-dependent enzyme [Elusimicrobiales bacterium]|nr:aminotransferase class V-fold PLP-dependent enzyme [Elusimicrobiales bacterium]